MKSARELHRDLCADAQERSPRISREDLTDIISDALGDSMDVDWNYAAGARYVINALVKKGVITLAEAPAPARTIPTTCIETIDGDPDTAARLPFQIKVF